LSYFETEMKKHEMEEEIDDGISVGVIYIIYTMV